MAGCSYWLCKAKKTQLLLEWRDNIRQATEQTFHGTPRWPISVVYTCRRGVDNNCQLRLYNTWGIDDMTLCLGYQRGNPCIFNWWSLNNGEYEIFITEIISLSLWYRELLSVISMFFVNSWLWRFSWKHPSWIAQNVRVFITPTSMKLDVIIFCDKRLVS